MKLSFTVSPVHKPEPVDITIDGDAYVAPCTLYSVPAGTYDLDVVDLIITKGGKRYTFSKWVIGGVDVLTNATTQALAADTVLQVVYTETLLVTGISAIKEAIKTLVADEVGHSTGDVTKWLDAEPHPTRYPSTCFAWVEWSGGPEQPETQDDLDKVEDVFYVVFCIKHTNPETAEALGIQLATAAEVLLKADNTLQGTVQDSRITNREHEKVFQGDYAIHAVRITVDTWRWVQS